MFYNATSQFKRQILSYTQNTEFRILCFALFWKQSSSIVIVYICVVMIQVQTNVAMLLMIMYADILK